MQRAWFSAAVEKIEEKRKPDDFFGHRKRVVTVSYHVVDWFFFEKPKNYVIITL